MRERITTTLKFPDIELCSHEPAPLVCRIWRPFSSFNYNPQSGEAHDEMIRWRKNSSHIQHSSRKWIIPRDSRTRNQERAKWNLIIKYGNFNCVFVVVVSWTSSSSVGCFFVGSKKELDTLRTVEDFFGSFGNLLDNWKLLDSVGVEQKENDTETIGQKDDKGCLNCPTINSQTYSSQLMHGWCQLQSQQPGNLFIYFANFRFSSPIFSGSCLSARSDELLRLSRAIIGAIEAEKFCCILLKLS